jgi:energy-coupling factor transporter ATP-binding protein EcfA2
VGNSSDNSFYIGLRSYNQTTSSKFIGKDKEIDSLLSVLQKHHFVCLTGAEGSGKTSLIQAGLIPRLLSGFQGEVGSEWSVCSFRPSAFPLDNFKQALTFDGVLNLENKPNTTDILDYGDVFHSMKELSLASIYRNSEIFNKKNLLVVIDQVEDLFRFNKDFNHLESNDDDLLFDIAGKSVSIKGLPIYFLLSINSLFVSRLSQYQSLQELVSQSQYSIQNLSPTALKKVINKGGLKKSTSLDLSIDQIYNLINEDISYLPNLQFYLKLRAADNYKENLSIENCI